MTRRTLVAVSAAVVVVGLGVGLGLGLSGGGTPSRGPEGVALQQVPDLAPAGTTASGAPVDGVTCRTSMQQTTGYHIHVHLAIFVQGRQRRIPAGAGIAAPRLEEHMTGGLFVDNGVSGCLYWLHVHADDGIIHVESPVQQLFELGQFFDIWNQPLGPNQVGSARGTVVAFENGKRISGDPRNIPLLPHAVIQLDIGTPVVPYQPVTFDVTGQCASNSRGCAFAPGG